MESKAVIEKLVEGRGEPGYDMAIVYQVTFRWRGRVWKKNVEVTRHDRKEWAIHRAMASVMRQQGVDSSRLRLELHSARSTAKVRDISSEPTEDVITYG